jgi:hypothetical protein
MNDAPQLCSVSFNPLVEYTLKHARKTVSVKMFHFKIFMKPKLIR